MVIGSVGRVNRSKNLQIACKFKTEFLAVPLNRRGSELLRHVWKACNRQKRFGGSNPPLSAEY